jgi:hypothetical protein
VKPLVQTRRRLFGKNIVPIIIDLLADLRAAIRSASE